jgi:hypothetical protein
MMYASKDQEVAISYAKNRYSTNVTYVHRLIFDIKKAATGEDVMAALEETGGQPSDLLSEAHALSYERILSLLKRRGFDGAIEVRDFAFDGPEEIEVLAVFDAFWQVELVDPEPYMTLKRSSRKS